MEFDFSQPFPSSNNIEECRETIKALWQHCQSQQQTIIGLNERLNTNSTNSSLPPSSDSIRDRAKRFQEKDAWKKRTSAYWSNPRQGAQRGHKGHGRKLWDESRVDEIIPCFPESHCFYCQTGTVHHIHLRQRKQVFDIKDGRLFLTEYQIYGGKCECCHKKNRGVLPPGTPVGILSANALSRVSSLTGKYKLSKRESRELLIDFYGLTISVGTISNVEALVRQAIRTPVAEVGATLQTQTDLPLHSDETSHFNRNQLEWLWVSTTSHLTFFSIFPHRNKEAAQALIGSSFKGMLVTDRYGAYNWVPSEQRQYCWAHLKRDFKKIKTRAEYHEKQLGYSLLDQYRSLFYCWRKIKNGTENDTIYYKKRLLRTIRQFRVYLRRGRALEGTKTGAFCAKLLREWDCLWHFLRNPLVDPTNNHAERQLRHAVLWRKKSFGTQSNRGRQYVERILTCVMTCKQQQRNLTTFISECITAYWLNTPYPSLVKALINSE